MWLISLNKISWVFGTEWSWVWVGVQTHEAQRDFDFIPCSLSCWKETGPGMQQVQPFQLIRSPCSHPRAEVPLPPPPHEHAWPPRTGIQCVGSPCHSSPEHPGFPLTFYTMLILRWPSACSPTQRAPPAQRNSPRAETQQSLFILSL